MVHDASRHEGMWGMEVHLHLFLNLELDWGEWSVSQLLIGCDGKSDPGSVSMGWRWSKPVPMTMTIMSFALWRRVVWYKFNDILYNVRNQHSDLLQNGRSGIWIPVRGPEAHPPPVQGVPGLYPGAKRSVRGVDHRPFYLREKTAGTSWLERCLGPCSICGRRGNKSVFVPGLESAIPWSSYPQLSYAAS
jgi:hypothetical protein